MHTAVRCGAVRCGAVRCVAKQDGAGRKGTERGRMGRKGVRLDGVGRSQANVPCSPHPHPSLSISTLAISSRLVSCHPCPTLSVPSHPGKSDQPFQPICPLTVNDKPQATPHRPALSIRIHAILLYPSPHQATYCCIRTSTRPFASEWTTLTPVFSSLERNAAVSCRA